MFVVVKGSDIVKHTQNPDHGKLTERQSGCNIVAAGGDCRPVADFRCGKMKVGQVGEKQQVG